VKRSTFLIGLSVVLACGALTYVLLPPTRKAPASTRGLRFVSLAWQEQALATNRAIVAEWNAANPGMQVEYVQGTWNSVHDYLITSFETGDVPDVFHYESSVIVDFAMRGFLADLGPMIEPEMKDDILDVAWASVTRPDGQISGVPFLMESLIGLYNRDLLDKAAIEPPTLDKPWSWRDLRAAAIKLTADTSGDGTVDRWGAAIGLRNSGNIIMNLSIGFGGSFFRREGEKYVVRVGPEVDGGQLHDVSYVGATYGIASRSLGSVALLGPLRMDYDKAIRAVRAAAFELSRLVEDVYEDE